MLDFIIKTIKIFFSIIFIAIPAGLFVFFLIAKFLTICISIGGTIGLFVGFFLLISMILASLCSF